jgi:hypothetical protein
MLDLENISSSCNDGVIGQIAFGNEMPRDNQSFVRIVAIKTRQRYLFVQFDGCCSDEGFEWRRLF